MKTLKKLGESVLFVMCGVGFVFIILRASQVLPNGPGDFSTEPAWHGDAVESGHGEWYSDGDDRQFRWRECGECRPAKAVD